jgi:hypothetical protein
MFDQSPGSINYYSPGISPGISPGVSPMVMTQTVHLDLWFVFSILSWIFYLSTAGAGIYYLKRDGEITFIWMITKINSDDVAKQHYVPIQMSQDYLVALFSVILFLTAAQFIFYLITRLTNSNIFEASFYGAYTRFHFLPMSVLASLFIIGIALNRELDENGGKVDKVETKKYAYSSMILSLTGIALFVSMHTQAGLRSIIQKLLYGATYSCCVALLVYNFFYTLVYMYDEVNSKLAEEYQSDESKWLSNCGIAFSVLIGLVNVSFGVGLRSAILLLVNLAIYTGMVFYFFNIDEEVRKNYNDNWDGIIDIIQLGITFLSLFFALNPRFTW